MTFDFGGASNNVAPLKFDFGGGGGGSDFSFGSSVGGEDKDAKPMEFSFGAGGGESFVLSFLFIFSCSFLGGFETPGSSGGFGNVAFGEVRH